MLDELKCYIAQKKVIQIIHIITVLDFVIDISNFYWRFSKTYSQKMPEDVSYAL